MNNVAPIAARRQSARFLMFPPFGIGTVVIPRLIHGTVRPKRELLLVQNKKTGDCPSPLCNHGHQNMDSTQREFLGTSEASETMATPKAGEDYALVIGVNDYAKIRPLRGAIADANAFARWLVDEAGGNIPAANVHRILSKENPLTPIGYEINDALEDILIRANETGGRRFYFYFSGHGCVGDRASDISLCMANWSELRRRAALSSEAWLDVVVRSGAFAEVVFFLDCCRVWAVRAVGLPPHIDFGRPVERDEPTRIFLAYATEFQRKAVETASEELEVRGIFTRCLLAGLSGEAAFFGPRVTAASLKLFLEKRVRSESSALGIQQRAEVLDGLLEDASFGRAKPSPSRVTRTGVAWALSDRSASTIKYSLLLDGHHLSGNGKRQSLPEEPPYMRSPAWPWLSLYRENLYSDLESSAAEWQRTFYSPIDSEQNEPDNLSYVFVAIVNGESSSADWFIEDHGARTFFDVENAWTVHGTGAILMRSVASGTMYLGQDDGREYVFRAYPRFTTQLVLDANGPLCGTARLLLNFVPDSRYAAKPPILDVMATIASGLDVLGEFSENIPAEIIEIMRGGSFENPIWGFLAGYLACKERHPDANVIETIADQLEALLGVCPDVHALRLRVALLRGAPIPAQPYSEPPIFRDGLLAFVEASHQVPEIIAHGSLLEHACVHRLVDTPFSCWYSQTRRIPMYEDWLSLAIAEACSSDPALDAQTLAHALGVPPLAVKARQYDDKEQYALILNRPETNIPLEKSQFQPIHGIAFIPFLRVSPDVVTANNLGPGALRVVAACNGERDVVDVIEHSGLSELIAIAHLRYLVLRGMIEIHRTPK